MKSVINFGIRPNYEPWENFLVRKLNFIALIGFLNAVISFIVFPQIGIYGLQAEMIVMMSVSLTALILNRYAGYLAATYLIYFSAAVLMFFLTLKMGLDSYVVVFFFPLILSVIQLMGRRETWKHMVVMLAFFLFSLLATTWAIHVDFMAVIYPPEAFKSLRLFMIVLSMTTSIAFFAIITYESTRQEKRINRMLHEKEVLLAEVYHRVKNNMSIVTSLLNLKKNSSDSPEVKEALEACRSRVYSMSLVHEKFLSQNSPSGIDFTQYAKDLIVAVTDSFGGSDAVEVQIAADELSLNVAQAIPCGLILNELLTNSFKHAGPKTPRLVLTITLLKTREGVTILYSDNGPGFDPDQVIKNGSMGLELIHSLCEQLDLTCKYTRGQGSHFEFRFTPKR